MEARRLALIVNVASQLFFELWLNQKARGGITGRLASQKAVLESGRNRKCCPIWAQIDFVDATNGTRLRHPFLRGLC